MIGIDISDHSVKVVRLSNRSPHHLLARGWQEIPERLIEHGRINDERSVKQIVMETFKKCGLATGCDDAVIASIPESESFLRVIEIPEMDESEISEAVKWEVGQHIPFGLEKVYLDWQWVNQHAAQGRAEVLVGAAEKSIVNQLYSVLASLNLDVAALELESQAFIRSLISPELKQRQGLLVVDLGGAATNVAVHDQGTIRFTATLRKGVRDLLSILSAEERTNVMCLLTDCAPVDVTKAVPKIMSDLEALVVEVHGVVEYYTGLAPQRKISEILLTGGGSNLPGLDQAFLRIFDNVHVQRGNPWVNVLIPGRSAEAPMKITESVHYATAVGLALRKVDI